MFVTVWSLGKVDSGLAEVHPHRYQTYEIWGKIEEISPERFKIYSGKSRIFRESLFWLICLDFLPFCSRIAFLSDFEWQRTFSFWRTSPGRGKSRHFHERPIYQNPSFTDGWKSVQNTEFLALERNNRIFFDETEKTDQKGSPFRTGCFSNLFCQFINRNMGGKRGGIVLPPVLDRWPSFQISVSSFPLAGLAEFENSITNRPMLTAIFRKYPHLQFAALCDRSWILMKRISMCRRKSFIRTRILDSPLQELNVLETRKRVSLSSRGWPRPVINCHWR